MACMDMLTDKNSLRYEPLPEADGFDRQSRPVAAPLPIIEL